MPTTVNISQTAGTPLLWSTTTQSWNDAVVGPRTWDGAYDPTVSITYYVDVGETMSVADGLTSGVSINKSELVAFAEVASKDYFDNISETLAFAETVMKGSGLNPQEAIAFAEGIGNSVGFIREIAESIGFTEVYGNGIGVNRSETITLAEGFDRVATFIKSISENLTFAEALAKTHSMSVSEVLAISDRLRKMGDYVLADALVSSVEVSATDFATMLSNGAAVGYETWRDFSPGDYEFRQAMFRVMIDSKSQDRGLITALQTAIDVPDVLDRGSATITNATNGVNVVFSRAFHVVPEVTMTVKSGVGTSNPVAAEFLVLPTRTGFTARLRDTANGALVTGSLSWSAAGY